MNKMYPKKIVMIEQQKPYRKISFDKTGTGYEQSWFYTYTTTDKRFLSNEQFIRAVVDYKENNYKVVEIEE